jgi:hypothetical protein
VCFFESVSRVVKSGVRGFWSVLDFDRVDLFVVERGGRFSGFWVKSIFWDGGGVGLDVGLFGTLDLGLGWSGFLLEVRGKMLLVGRVPGLGIRWLDEFVGWVLAGPEFFILRQILTGVHVLIWE